MKLLSIALLSVLFSLTSLNEKQSNSLIVNENKLMNEVLLAIQSDNYQYFIESFAKGKLNVNQSINGKTILIYATILNKPEMIRLLIQSGAFFSAECSKGQTAMDYAYENNSYKALAELIVIAA